MKDKLTLCILFVLIQISIYPQFNYQSSNSTFIGRWAGGRCLTNTSVGNYTYIGDGGIFRILNTTDPSNPICIDSVETPGVVQKIVIVDTLAFVADGIGGLRIINISNPSSASEIGGYDTPGYTYSVAVSGNFAYIADGNSGFKAFDVSIPSSPNPVKSLSFSKAYDIAVGGNYAYVASSGLGLEIIDISIPASSAIINTFDTPGTAYGVDVDGIYAFIADGPNGLLVINVSTPSSPFLANSISTPDILEKFRCLVAMPSLLQIILVLE